jgi:hypothetical protein
MDQMQVDIKQIWLSGSASNNMIFPNLLCERLAHTTS